MNTAQGHIGAQGRKARQLQHKQPRIFHMGGGGNPLPPITELHKRHMSLVLDLDEEAAALLPEEEQWKALYWKIGWEKLV